MTERKMEDAKAKTSLVAVVSFAGGILGTIFVNYWNEGYKADLELRNLGYESRADLWKSTAEHFAQYISNWDRLRLFELASLDPNVVGKEKCTKILQSRKKDGDIHVRKRKDHYVEERDKAKDFLIADLEQTRNLFGGDVEEVISKFDEFREKYKTANACQLPEAAELRAVQRAILSAMLEQLSKYRRTGK